MLLRRLPTLEWGLHEDIFICLDSFRSIVHTVTKDGNMLEGIRDENYNETTYKEIYYGCFHVFFLITDSMRPKKGSAKV